MRPLAVAGYMSSGKSAVAAHLVSTHGYVSRAFGDVVRQEVAARNLDPTDRGSLQAVGAELVQSIGAAGMVARVLGDTRDRPLVVEGVRHLAVLNELRRTLPSLIFVFLTAPPDVLEQRWRDRGDASDRHSSQSHAVEGESDDLRSAADLVIDTRSFEPKQIAELLAVAASW